MMNSQDRARNNKLIVEFMYPEFVDYDLEDGDGIEIEGNMLAKMAVVMKQYDLVKYHESWDWLMPVVGKIIDLYHDYYDEYGYYEENMKKVLDSLSMVEIKYTYQKVADFIKWYNENKPNEKSNQ